jgi:hypothetical protein
MPSLQPSASDVHVDAIMTNHSVAYIQQAADFVAAQFAPRVPVQKQSDKYYVFTKGDWFRDEAQQRAGSSESVGAGYSLSTDSYFSEQFSIHKDVSRDVKANTDNPLDWRRNATQLVTQRLLLKREVEFASKAFAANWGTNLVGGSNFTKWDDYSNSDPIDNIEDGVSSVLKNTGLKPNTLLLGYEAWKALKHHPDIVDRYKYSSAESISVDMVARLLELDRIIVAKAVKNTGIEGASDSFDFVSGKNALLAHVAAAPGVEVPTAMYMFSWTELFAGAGVQSDMVISSIEMPERNGTTRIEGDMCFDFKIVGSDLGYFFGSCVA